jgi:hypothetical protein
MDHRTNTSIIFVSSTSGTPDFEEFRSGDYLLTPAEVSEEAVERARVVHSSAFALSLEPCRSAVVKAFRLASEGGKLVSFDPNYSRRVWPEYREARKTIEEVYRYVSVTKPSLDDAGRIFGREYEPEEYIRMFHELGPRTVVLTMGRDGVLVSEDGEVSGRDRGRGLFLGRLPGRPPRRRPARALHSLRAGDSGDEARPRGRNAGGDRPPDGLRPARHRTVRGGPGGQGSVDREPGLRQTLREKRGRRA